MATAAEIANDVRNIIAEQLGVDLEEVKDSSEIVGDLNADSLDVVKLVISIEEAFDIVIPDEEGMKLVTVGDAITYVGNNILASSGDDGAESGGDGADEDGSSAPPAGGVRCR